MLQIPRILVTYLTLKTHITTHVLFFTKEFSVQTHRAVGCVSNQYNHHYGVGGYDSSLKVRKPTFGSPFRNLQDKTLCLGKDTEKEFSLSQTPNVVRQTKCNFYVQHFNDQQPCAMRINSNGQLPEPFCYGIGRRNLTISSPS